MTYNPLNIRPTAEGSYIEFPMEPELIDKLFYCSEIVTYTSHEEGIERLVARYNIVDRQDEKNRFLIETIKKNENDFDIRYFELLEKLDFDEEFMSMVGTSPFAYAHPKYVNVDFMEYDKVEQDGEEFIDQQFSIDVETEEDDSYKEWCEQDDNGWFYTVTRSTGILRKFSDKSQTYSWIYDRKPTPTMPIYMLIEVEALLNYDDYATQRPKINIYEGRKFLISDIKAT